MSYKASVYTSAEGGHLMPRNGTVVIYETIAADSAPSVPQLDSSNATVASS